MSKGKNEGIKLTLINTCFMEAMRKSAVELKSIINFKKQIKYSFSNITK